MKIIDLLVKISKGEEVPKKIKYEGEIFERVISGMNINDYLDEDGNYLFQEYDWLQNINDEVEILEEDKKIEPIKYEVNKVIGLDDCVDKINEIIDKLNKEE